jgi:hypothetical protein
MATIINAGTTALTVTPDATGALTIQANGTSALAITANGQITTANAPFILTGGQIQFPSTQIPSADANTLDDYEEGTWTPTATAQTGSITSFTSNGNYTKIGNTVFVRCQITITNVGSASGRLDGGGLPFTGTAQDRPFVALVRENAVTGDSFMAYAQNNATTFQITALTSVGPITWSNNYSYVFTATYQVA